MNRVFKQDKQRFVDHEEQAVLGKLRNFLDTQKLTVGELSIYILNGKIMEILFYSQCHTHSHLITDGCFCNEL